MIRTSILIAAFGAFSKVAFGTLPYTGVNLAGAEFAPYSLPGTYGVDYTYPTIAEVTYYQSKGMNTFRLPFLWERLQPDLNAGFDPTQLGYITNFVTQATAQGAHVILDVHDFAQYISNYTAHSIGSPQVSYSQFASLWGGLATAFGSNPNVMFGLMNEPKGDQVISTPNWLFAAQGAVDAIRAAGATNPILVPGNYYTGAWSWSSPFGSNIANSAVLGALTDPGVNGSGKNILYEVHQYLDADYSGQSPSIDHDPVTTLTGFTDWLRTTGNVGFLGEFGVGVGLPQQIAATSLLNFLEANSDVWDGWTWWAGGSSWPDNYFLNLEPQNGLDAPQLAYLEPFLNPVPEPPTWLLATTAGAFFLLKRHRASHSTR